MLRPPPRRSRHRKNPVGSVRTIAAWRKIWRRRILPTRAICCVLPAPNFPHDACPVPLRVLPSAVFPIPRTPMWATPWQFQRTISLTFRKAIGIAAKRESTEGRSPRLATHLTAFPWRSLPQAARLLSSRFRSVMFSRFFWHRIAKSQSNENTKWERTNAEIAARIEPRAEHVRGVLGRVMSPSLPRRSLHSRCRLRRGDFASLR